MARMTWSIIARDRDTGQFGIAVATFFFASGALVPHLKSRVGAIATQVSPFGNKADMAIALRNVRFRVNSGHHSNVVR